MSLPVLRVAAASYEGSLFGWLVSPSSTEATATVDSEREDAVTLPLSMEMNWGFHCTTGSIKAIAVSQSGTFVVCGGTDERIKIFNTRDNRAVGELTQHTGTVTCLAFVNDTHLISGSEDCTLCIWRVHDWACLHILGGHKRAVTHIAVHPSGKLALSTSLDGSLRLWNLVEGRCAFTRRIGGQGADRVVWCPEEAQHLYLLVRDRTVQVFDASDNSELASVEFKLRVNAAVFLRPRTSTSESTPRRPVVAAASDDRKITFLSLDGRGSILTQLDVTELGSRPKDLTVQYIDPASVRSASAGKGDRKTTDSDGEVIVVALSSGKIAILSSALAIAGASSNTSSSTCYRALLGLASVVVEPRFTCVTAWVPNVSKSNSSVVVASTNEPPVALVSSVKNKEIDVHQSAEKIGLKHKGEANKSKASVRQGAPDATAAASEAKTKKPRKA